MDCVIWCVCVYIYIYLFFFFFSSYIKYRGGIWPRFFTSTRNIYYFLCESNNNFQFFYFLFFMGLIFRVAIETFKSFWEYVFLGNKLSLNKIGWRGLISAQQNPKWLLGCHRYEAWIMFKSPKKKNRWGGFGFSKKTQKVKSANVEDDKRQHIDGSSIRLKALRVCS